MLITSLIPDPKNLNKGTKRGNEMVAESLKSYGAGRSILIDKHGKIIAGNKTAANALAAGIENVEVIQTDGTKIIAVQRMDLDLDSDSKAKALALADNRTSEIGLEWDTANLNELSFELDMKPFFSAEEMTALIAPVEAPEDGYGAPDREQFEGHYKPQYGVIVICKDEADQQKIYEQLTSQNLECKVVVT